MYRDGVPIGWTIDFMRRTDESMNGIMEFLIASAALHMKESGAEVLSLSGAPLATKPLAAGQSAPPPTVMTRLSEFLANTLEPAYGFSSLFRFKAKFNPDYETISMAYPDPIELPTIGMAIGKAYLPQVSPKEAVALVRTPDEVGEADGGSDTCHKWQRATGVAAASCVDARYGTAARGDARYGTSVGPGCWALAPDHTGMPVMAPLRERMRVMAPLRERMRVMAPLRERMRVMTPWLHPVRHHIAFRALHQHAAPVMVPRPRTAYDGRTTAHPIRIAEAMPETRTTTVRDLRRSNQSRTLWELYLHGPLTHQELATAAGVSIATVSNVMGHLLRQGAVLEVGVEDSNGGRPPRPLPHQPRLRPCDRRGCRRDGDHGRVVRPADAGARVAPLRDHTHTARTG